MVETLYRATPAGVEEIPADEAAAIRAEQAAWEATRLAQLTPNMPVLRQQAFDSAMAYSNAITGKITGAYADAEARSWTVQEAEARAVLAGETLAAGAMLSALADDKAVPLADYAAGVVAKADAFRQIAVAAVRLRRGAQTLLSDEISTPEALEAAVAGLRAQAHAAAQALGIES